MFVNLNDWVPAGVAPSMKSEETTGDKEEDEEEDDTSDFHLDHKFLGTTDTMEPRLKKTTNKAGNVR